MVARRTPKGKQPHPKGDSDEEADQGRTNAAVCLILAVAGAFVAPRAALATPEADGARADIQKTFGFVPGFLKLVPDLALPGAWMEFKALEVSPNTALPRR